MSSKFTREEIEEARNRCPEPSRYNYSVVRILMSPKIPSTFDTPILRIEDDIIEFRRELLTDPRTRTVFYAWIHDNEIYY